MLVFLDGVGIGPADPARNPFLVASLPVLHELLGGLPTLDDPSPGGAHARCVPLDATLGTAGTPQSGTGQTALLTGVNAAERFGSHFGPWVPVALRRTVEETSVLRRAVDAGHGVAFANAYPRGWPAHTPLRRPDGPVRRIRPAAPPLAARAAGLLTRDHEALARGDAVASEIENTGWRVHLGHAVPDVTAEAAGAVLAHIAAEHRLTFFAHYATDTAGHRGGMPAAVAALERVDRFLGGFLSAAPPETVLIVSSDHGNVEDVTGGHTRNPVPGLVVGPEAERRADSLGSILDVADAVLDWLAEG